MISKQTVNVLKEVDEGFLSACVADEIRCFDSYFRPSYVEEVGLFEAAVQFCRASTATVERLSAVRGMPLTVERFREAVHFVVKALAITAVFAEVIADNGVIFDKKWIDGCTSPGYIDRYERITTAALAEATALVSGCEDWLSGRFALTALRGDVRHLSRRMDAHLTLTEVEQFQELSRTPFLRNVLEGRLGGLVSDFVVSLALYSTEPGRHPLEGVAVEHPSLMLNRILPALRNAGVVAKETLKPVKVNNPLISWKGSPSWRADGSIYAWSYKPPTNVLLAEKEELHDATVMFGVETEVSHPDAYGGDDCDVSLEMASITDGSKVMFAKHDGSIEPGGCEFVTHPFSARWYWENLTAFDPMLDLRHEGARAWVPSCGMHIHVSLSALSTGDIYKIMSFVFSSGANAMALLAGRRANRYCEYDADQGDIRAAAKAKKRGARYTAIRLTDYTMEFRMFKSTLNPRSWHKNVQTVMALIDWQRSVSMQEVLAADAGAKFVKYIRSRKDLPHLHEWANENKRLPSN